MLTSLGKCTDLSHVGLYPNILAYRVTPLWSKGDFVQMVQRVQENGAAGLWSFELDATLLFRKGSGRNEGCEAM